MDKLPTKNDDIFEAAVYLFYMKGYSATSIRDIARRAGGNSANIAYHFQHKQGLLEYCFTDFFEGYMDGIEKIVEQLPIIGPKECILEFTKFCLHYYREKFLLTRLVLREISVDSSLNREIYTTYLSKEKFFINLILDAGMECRELKKVNPSLLVMKLKALLNEPFIQAQYFIEVWHLFPNEMYFINNYQMEIEQFLRDCLFLEQVSPLPV